MSCRRIRQVGYGHMCDQPQSASQRSQTRRRIRGSRRKLPAGAGRANRPPTPSRPGGCRQCWCRIPTPRSPRTRCGFRRHRPLRFRPHGVATSRSPSTATSAVRRSPTVTRPSIPGLPDAVGSLGLPDPRRHPDQWHTALAVGAVRIAPLLLPGPGMTGTRSTALSEAHRADHSATPRDSTTTATVARSRHTNDSRHPIWLPTVTEPSHRDPEGDHPDRSRRHDVRRINRCQSKLAASFRLTLGSGRSAAVSGVALPQRSWSVLTSSYSSSPRRRAIDRLHRRPVTAAVVLRASIAINSSTASTNSGMATT
jgi:hypothetical protein